MTSPSSILSRAADLIRDTAAAATRGPWETIGDTGGVWREASPERTLRRFVMAGENAEALQATLNKADTMIRAGKDAAQARKDFADELRKAGFSDAQAAQFEGKRRG